MKVLKGFYKGVELAVPEGGLVRPTVDHFKKHISRIARGKNPKIVWDLFAGSGGVGIELLSEGAVEAVFVEQLSRAMDCLKLNIAECRLKNPSTFSQQKHECILSPVEGFLQSPRLEVVKGEPDLIFLDPPYTPEALEKVLAPLLICPLVTTNALILVEHISGHLPSYSNATLEFQEIYGPKVLTGLRRK